MCKARTRHRRAQCDIGAIAASLIYRLCGALVPLSFRFDAVLCSGVKSGKLKDRNMSVPASRIQLGIERNCSSGFPRSTQIIIIIIIHYVKARKGRRCQRGTVP